MSLLAVMPSPTDVLRGLVSIAILCAVAWAISSHRRAFPWRVVLGGIGLQITLAVVLLAVPGTACEALYFADRNWYAARVSGPSEDGFTVQVGMWQGRPTSRHGLSA